MFDHIQIKVADLQKTLPFYEAVLKTLGHSVVLEDDVVVGIGKNTHDMIEIRQADAKALLSGSVHIGFTAKSEEEVKEFHRVALEHGAQDNGAPGLRPHYEDGYYAAFVIDPNGHNLEAVFSKNNKS